MTATTLPDSGTDRRRAIRLDLVVALLLALVLSVGWAIHDWPRLSRMLLPDLDDMMRLAQVRDWLAGQGINDWTQYRVAPPHGAPMHWSRINDFGIAGLILAAAPFVGRAHAELFAVLTYPALLFVCAIFLSARIGRRLWQPGGGPVAAVLTALAFPGTTVFIPGRIDHHALQVVLIQLVVLALMRAPTLASGAMAGLATAVSLVVGLETAPQLAALIGVMALLWTVRGVDERMRLAGFGGALVLVTLGFIVFLRPTLWTAVYCDAFTPASSTGTLLVGGAFGALAALSPRLATWRSRLASGALLGAAALGATMALYPSCLNGPYGAVDPFLRRAFLPFIGEAIGLFHQSGIALIVSMGGLSVAACVAIIWAMVRERRRWAELLPLSAVVGVSALVTLFQVRAAYIGAPLAAPLLAGWVVAARQRKSWQMPAVILAWLAGAGMAYFQLGQYLESAFGRAPAEAGKPTPPVVCSGGGAWAQVDRYPPGVTMASTTLAPYLIGATHHSTVGAGYHRNNDGNMAMYRFFLSPPDRARAIERLWNTHYVAFCPGDFSEIDVTHAYPDSLATQLQSGRPPAWLVPLPLSGTPLRFYRILPQP